jgi:hypothetical protein
MYKAVIELNGHRATITNDGEGWSCDDAETSDILREHYIGVYESGEVRSWMPDTLRMLAKAAKRDLKARIISITPPPRPDRTALPPVY